MTVQYRQLKVTEMDSELLKRLEHKFDVELDKEEYVYVYKTAKDFVKRTFEERDLEMRMAYLGEDYMVDTMLEVLVQSEELFKEFAKKLAERATQADTDYQVYVDEETGQFVHF